MNSEKLQQTEITEVGKSTSRLIWVIPVASLAATMANIVFYFIVTKWFNEPLLMLEQSPPPTVVPMGVDEVILFSLIWSLGAGLIYAFLTAVSARPERLFIIISAVVLLVSLALPLMMPTPPVAMSAKLSLVMMHIIGAVVVVGLLVTLGQKREEVG